MDVAAARRSATLVGASSGAIGGVLLLVPERADAFVGLHSVKAMRVIGAADFLLAPGLIWGEPRVRYVFGRVALNLAIVGFMLSSRAKADDPRRPAAVSLALAAITVGDSRIAWVLARSGS